MIKLRDLLTEEKFNTEPKIGSKANFTKYGIDDISNDILTSMHNDLNRMIIQNVPKEPRGSMFPERRYTAKIFLNYLINNGLENMGLVANRTLYKNLISALKLKISQKYENRYDLEFVS